LAREEAQVDHLTISVATFPQIGSAGTDGMTNMELALAANTKQFDRFVEVTENT
jgi:hypothetical protein